MTLLEAALVRVRRHKHKSSTLAPLKTALAKSTRMGSAFFQYFLDLYTRMTTHSELPLVSSILSDERSHSFTSSLSICACT